MLFLGDSKLKLTYLTVDNKGSWTPKTVFFISTDLSNFYPIT